MTQERLVPGKNDRPDNAGRFENQQVVASDLAAET